MTEDEKSPVRINPAQSRYELSTEDGLAVAEYELSDGVVLFTHTETPPASQGKGVAARLVAGALADVRARGLKAEATCSYVAAYMKRHP